MSQDIETRVQVTRAMVRTLLPFGTVSAVEGEPPRLQVSSITEETFETTSAVQE